MDAQQFAYWLQGFAELSGEAPPTKAQWKSIREHLGLVFKKVTPPVAVPNQPDLNKLLKDIQKQSPAIPYIAPLSPTCAAGKLPPARSECGAWRPDPMGDGMGTMVVC